MSTDEHLMDQPVRVALLSRVEVDGLFGYLDHRLNFDEPSAEDQNMNLLYGENGSGKTTLLRLIYSSLSPNTNEGLRTYIAAVPFRRFQITTSSGSIIELTREKADRGSYRISFSSNGLFNSTILNVTVAPDFRVAAQDNPDLPHLVKEIGSLQVDLIYLSDDRRLRTTLPALRSAIERGRARARREPDEQPETLDRVARGQGDRNWLNLSLVASNVLDNFRREIFERVDSGQRSTNTIYLDLLRHLASAWSTEEPHSEYDFTQTLEELHTLEGRAAPLLKLGTMPRLPFSEFTEILTHAPESRQQDLLRILRPFLQSTKARIDAIEPIATVLTNLIDTLNVYLARKRVTFSIRNGFDVSTPTSDSLPLAALSSGEKHLFLLLCTYLLVDHRRGYDLT
jgi:energy-coupling factor transporter ATP-binding protein EcfA2